MAAGGQGGFIQASVYSGNPPFTSDYLCDNSRLTESAQLGSFLNPKSMGMQA